MINTGVEPSLRASAFQTPLFVQEILSWLRRRKTYIFQVKMVILYRLIFFKSKVIGCRDANSSFMKKTNA